MNVHINLEFLMKTYFQIRFSLITVFIVFIILLLILYFFFLEQNSSFEDVCILNCSRNLSCVASTCCGLEDSVKYNSESNGKKDKSKISETPNQNLCLKLASPLLMLIPVILKMLDLIASYQYLDQTWTNNHS